MFKKGDKVYSILKGWGEVKTIEENPRLDNYPLYVKFNNRGYENFTEDGKNIVSDLIPELYHTEPIITVPKRRVEHKGWIAVGKELYLDGSRLSSNIYPDNRTPSLLRNRLVQEITYYTEE